MYLMAPGFVFLPTIFIIQAASIHNSAILQEPFSTVGHNLFLSLGSTD